MLDRFGRGLAVGALKQTEKDKRPAQIVQGYVKIAFMDPIRPTHVSRRMPYDP
jgi:hypothetical protein